MADRSRRGGGGKGGGGGGGREELEEQEEVEELWPAHSPRRGEHSEIHSEPASARSSFRWTPLPPPTQLRKGSGQASAFVSLPLGKCPCRASFATQPLFRLAMARSRASGSLSRSCAFWNPSFFTTSMREFSVLSQASKSDVYGLVPSAMRPTTENAPISVLNRSRPASAVRRPCSTRRQRSLSFPQWYSQSSGFGTCICIGVFRIRFSTREVSTSHSQARMLSSRPPPGPKTPRPRWRLTACTSSSVRVSSRFLQRGSKKPRGTAVFLSRPLILMWLSTSTKTSCSSMISSWMISSMTSSNVITPTMW
mmetsp:Transcript_44599/g.124352  ORF Transcript_44599/g.124352 Transcript_44599/m.124352 type:complete len:309 (-) Transcript_44599:978-1904(-)